MNGGGKTSPPPWEKRESQGLSSVFCFCDSSAFSDENVPLFSQGLKYVKWRDISQTNPVMSISAGEGMGAATGGKGHNLLKWLIAMWKWNLLTDFSTSKFQLPSLFLLLFKWINCFHRFSLICVIYVFVEQYFWVHKSFLYLSKLFYIYRLHITAWIGHLSTQTVLRQIDLHIKLTAMLWKCRATFGAQSKLFATIERCWRNRFLLKST